MPDTSLAEQTKIQAEFVSKIAHDLKTPLTVISAYAQLILKKIEKGEPVTGDLATKIHQTALRMADQITAEAKKYRSDSNQ